MKRKAYSSCIERLSHCPPGIKTVRLRKQSHASRPAPDGLGRVLTPAIHWDSRQARGTCTSRAQVAPCCYTVPYFHRVQKSVPSWGKFFFCVRRRGAENVFPYSKPPARYNIDGTSFKIGGFSMTENRITAEKSRALPSTCAKRSAVPAPLRTTCAMCGPLPHGWGAGR